MTTKAKVAVVLPIYNVEKYLRQCLDSIINQTLKDIEIICVDDGSTDSCLQILQEYAAKDERIKVITQPNSLQGAARNHGLQYVTAPYVYFVDPDDWLDVTCLEKLYNKMTATDADVCILGALHYDDAQQMILPDTFLDMSFFQNRPSEVCRYTDIKNAVFRRWGPFFRIQKTDFLRQNNILFPENVQYEDAFFHVQCMILAQRITFCDENLYFYRINRPDSTMSSSTKNRYSFYIFNFLQQFDDFLHSQNIYEDMKEEYAKCIVGQIKYHFLRLRDDIKAEFIGRAEQFIKEHHLEEYISQTPSINKIWQDVLLQHYKVSVVIPIYNTEKYLPKCLDSLLSQTLQAIEIICVDDGSDDTCPQILQQYAAKDFRIKVITQSNKHTSDARNTGIKQVHAEYLMFVDSDDYLEPNALEILYNKMIEHEPDAVVCDVANFTDASIINEEQKQFYASYDEWFAKFAKPEGLYKTELNIHRQLASVAWNKLYKMNIIHQYNLEFPIELYNEDEFWLWAYMLHCQNFYFVPQKLYNYLHRPDSIMDKLYTSEKALDIFEQYTNVYKYIKKYKNIVPYKPILAKDFMTAATNRKNKIDSKYYPQLLKKVREYTFNCNPSDMMLDFYYKIRSEITDQNHKEKHAK